MATTVRQIRLNVKLYVNWLSCYNQDRACLQRSKTYCLNIHARLPWKAYSSTCSSLPCTCLPKKKRFRLSFVYITRPSESNCSLNSPQLDISSRYTHRRVCDWQITCVCVVLFIHKHKRLPAKQHGCHHSYWPTASRSLAFITMTDLLIQLGLGLLPSY